MKAWRKGNFACYRCGKEGHFRSACKRIAELRPGEQPAVSPSVILRPEAVLRLEEPVVKQPVLRLEEPVVKQPVLRLEEPVVKQPVLRPAAAVAAAPVEPVVKQPLLRPAAALQQPDLCKWCSDAHPSRECRRLKTRMCDDPECCPERCLYAHSAAELRTTIWFHTQMCRAVVHTSECRRAFAHTEEERWNALSALTAVHMLSRVLC